MYLVTTIMAIKHGSHCQLRGKCMIDEDKKTDYEFELYGGLSIEFQDIKIKSLTINEIRQEYGLSKILRLLSLSTVSRKQFKNVDEKVSLFDLVVHSELRKVFEMFLSVFVECDAIQYGEKTNSYYLKNKDKIAMLGKENFEEFLEVFRMAYCIDKNARESDRDDIDDELREILKGFEEEEDKIKNARGNTITLNSMIKAICCRHPSINCLNVGNCTIYQLKCDLVRLYQIDSNVFINTAMCSGTMTEKVDLEDYNWAKELN